MENEYFITSTKKIFISNKNIIKDEPGFLF
jgi:hypothetical protein